MVVRYLLVGLVPLKLFHHFLPKYGLLAVLNQVITVDGVLMTRHRLAVDILLDQRAAARNIAKRQVCVLLSVCAGG